jgi:predicted nucleic acid-binding protein
MTTVFLDTVGLVALWDEADPWNGPAAAAMKLLDAPSIRLVTTPYVLLECGNALARTPFRADVCQFREQLAKQKNLIDPMPEEIEEAWAAYQRDHAAGAGIVDHVSFIVMRRLGISDAFTNDRHFKAAGFNTLF